MKRVAVVISQFEETCQSLIWDGICDAARKNDVDLVTFPALSEDEIISHYPFIADFIDAGFFSSVILFTGAMSEYTSWAVVRKYANSFNIPVVSIAGSVDCCVSSVIINNQMGILNQIHHLVKVHNKKRIAFVKGPTTNEEANERYEAYIEGIASNGLEFDEDLIFDGDYSIESGKRAAKDLLALGEEVDAVLCADDYTAIGVIQELKQHKIYVPDNIAVIGFDDVEEATMISPSLSTVHQPFYSMGVASLEAAIQSNPPQMVVRNTTAVNRTSCGCIPKEIELFRSHSEEVLLEEKRPSKESFLKSMDSIIKYTVDTMEKGTEGKMEQYKAFLTDAMNQLCSIFFSIINDGGDEDLFLKRLSSLLNHNEEFSSSLNLWRHLVIQVLPMAQLQLEDSETVSLHRLLQEARIIIDSHYSSRIKQEHFARKQEELNIRESCQRIITSHSTDALFQTTMRELTDLGVKEAALVLFSNYASISYLDWKMPPESSVRGILLNGKQVEVDENGITIESKEILPSIYHPHIRAKNLLFLPLYFYGEYFGYLIIDVRLDALKEMYEELRLHISSAIKSCLMMDKLKALSMNDELTNLSNRRGFMLLTQELINRSKIKNQELILFFFDMDNLKIINDTYGHDEGDRAIKAAASILQRTFRTNDIIGRIGGDEFVVIIEREVKGLETIVEKRLFAAIENYNSHSNRPYAVELSMGLTVFSPDTTTKFEKIMNETDLNMLENKRQRKKARD